MLAAQFIINTLETSELFQAWDTWLLKAASLEKWMLMVYHQRAQQYCTVYKVLHSVHFVSITVLLFTPWTINNYTIAIKPKMIKPLYIFENIAVHTTTIEQ